MCPKVAQNATENLGYFICQIYDQQLEKIAQSGHTDCGFESQHSIQDGHFQVILLQKCFVGF